MTTPRATMTITPTGSRAKYWHTPQHCISYSSQTCKGHNGSAGRNAQECSQAVFDWLMERGLEVDEIDFHSTQE